MKKVTIIFVILMTVLMFGFTKRPQKMEYERVDGLKPVGKPLSGAIIFNDMETYGSWHMGRSVVKKDDVFDFSGNSLLAVWLGKPQQGECIAVDSIDMSGETVKVTAEKSACTDVWTSPYIYYKLPRTDKKAELLLK